MAIACGGSVAGLTLLGGAGARPLGLLISVIGAGLLVLSGLTRFTQISLRIIGMLAVILSVGALTVAVRMQGTAGTPAVGFLAFLPLIVLAAAPDNLLSVATAGVGSVVATLVLTGVPDETHRNWVIPAMAAAGLAVQGSRHHLRVVRSERAADEARIQTLEKLTESEAVRAGAERLALVGQLAAGVAHEINNPLAFATSNLRFIRSELQGHEDADLVDALNDTEQGLERIAQIVRDLKAATRSDDAGGTDARCTVQEAVSEALRLSSVKLKRVGQVETIVPDDLPEVRFQSRHLVQVLVNLLVNAADAVEERKVSGKVTLRVTRADDVGMRLRVHVEDDGPGFSPESMERLFKPFFTTKPPGKGTGLGLNLSRDFARRYGGELRAENRPEGGARMALELVAAEGLSKGGALHIDAA